MFAGHLATFLLVVSVLLTDFCVANLAEKVECDIDSAIQCYRDTLAEHPRNRLWVIQHCVIDSGCDGQQRLRGFSKFIRGILDNVQLSSDEISELLDPESEAFNIYYQNEGVSNCSPQEYAERMQRHTTCLQDTLARYVTDNDVSTPESVCAVSDLLGEECNKHRKPCFSNSSWKFKTFGEKVANLGALKNWFPGIDFQNCQF